MVTENYSSASLFCCEQNAKTGMMKRLGDLFRQHPDRFVSRETAFLKVASGCCAYTDVRNIENIRKSCLH